jgi:hypothetical protein
MDYLMGIIWVLLMLIATFTILSINKPEIKKQPIYFDYKNFRYLIS